MKFLISIFILFASIVADENFVDFKAKIDKINADLSGVENNDSKIDLLIREKNLILKDMLSLIKQEALVFEFDDAKQIELVNFLNQRIAVNTQRGNLSAIYRDKLKLESLNFDRQMYNSFNFFSSDSTEFKTKIEITKYLKALKELLNQKMSDELEQYYQKNRVIVGNQVIDELKKNYEELASKRVLYGDIINFLLQNIEKVKSENIIIETLRLSYIVDVIDNIEIIKRLNLYLDYYFNIKAGKIIVAIVIIFFYIILQYLLIWGLFSIKKDSYINQFLSRTIKFYLRLLIITRGFEIIANYIFYDSDFVHKVRTFYIMIFIFAIYKLINSAIADYSEKILVKYPNVRKELVNFLIIIFKIFLFIIIGLLFLREIGYDITAVAASLGVGGIAIALAAKDTLTNFFGLINIILGNSFSQGDVIKTSAVEGSVVEIGIRSTTIRTFTNELVSVPNSQLSDTAVVNISKRKIGRRIKIVLNFTYQSKQEDLKQAIEQIEKLLIAHPEIAYDSFKDSLQLSRSAKLLAKDDILGIKKVLTVRLDALSPYSIDVLVYCFTKSVDWLDWMRIKEEIIFDIMKIAENNNLEFAYPTNTTFFRRG